MRYLHTLYFFFASENISEIKLKNFVHNFTFLFSSVFTAINLLFLFLFPANLYTLTSVYPHTNQQKTELNEFIVSIRRTKQKYFESPLSFFPLYNFSSDSFRPITYFFHLTSPDQIKASCEISLSLSLSLSHTHTPLFPFLHRKQTKAFLNKRRRVLICYFLKIIN